MSTHVWPINHLPLLNRQKIWKMHDVGHPSVVVARLYACVAWIPSSINIILIQCELREQIPGHFLGVDKAQIMEAIGILRHLQRLGQDSVYDCIVPRKM